MASYQGTIRPNPVGQHEIIVAAFTGNSKQDRRLKPDLIANLEAQDPDILFFSGDQVYDHMAHLGAWLLFGRQFGEIIRDRPMISIPDDHDVGQANLWGAGGKVSTNAAGDDGGYFMPIEYVRAVERAQTWHLPDPVDPEPVERGLGVYFTALNCHICGDQHLGCVAQYGVEDWRDGNLDFCVPSIVNYYPRQWLPLDAPRQSIDGPLPHLGDYTEGFGNKLTMYAYANPQVFPAPLTNLAASASGHGLVRFDKTTRQITIECWPRGVDVTQPGAKQYPGWPITIDQLDNYGRRPVAWLPEIEAPTGMTNAVVQVWDERNGELVYTLRTKSARFKPWVFAEGTYTVRIGEPPSRMTARTGQRTVGP